MGRFLPSREAQIREAFRNVEKVLDHGGLSFSSVVEMTTYHLNLQEHIELFRRIRDEFVVEPYPAWTAIEVLGLVEKGATSGNSGDSPPTRPGGRLARQVGCNADVRELLKSHPPGWPLQ